VKIDASTELGHANFRVNIPKLIVPVHTREIRTAICETLVSDRVKNNTTLRFLRTFATARDVKLSQHDLRQLDDGWLKWLPQVASRALSLKLFPDLKKAKGRLQQHPNNSFLPPSSRAP